MTKPCRWYRLQRHHYEISLPRQSEDYDHHLETCTRCGDEVVVIRYRVGAATAHCSRDPGTVQTYKDMVWIHGAIVTAEAREAQDQAVMSGQQLHYDSDADG
jgi:hypothetical protein